MSNKTYLPILFDMGFEQIKNFMGIIYYDLEIQACDTEELQD